MLSCFKENFRKQPSNCLGVCLLYTGMVWEALGGKWLSFIEYLILFLPCDVSTLYIYHYFNINVILSKIFFSNQTYNVLMCCLNFNVTLNYIQRINNSSEVSQREKKKNKQYAQYKFTLEQILLEYVSSTRWVAPVITWVLEHFLYQGVSFFA